MAFCPEGASFFSIGRRSENLPLKMQTGPAGMSIFQSVNESELWAGDE
jgi:hypothetical protein